MIASHRLRASYVDGVSILPAASPASPASWPREGATETGAADDDFLAAVSRVRTEDLVDYVRHHFLCTTTTTEVPFTPPSNKYLASGRSWPIAGLCVVLEDAPGHLHVIRGVAIDPLCQEQPSDQNCPYSFLHGLLHVCSKSSSLQAINRLLMGSQGPTLRNAEDFLGPFTTCTHCQSYNLELHAVVHAMVHAVESQERLKP